MSVDLNKLPFHDLGIAGIIGTPPLPAKNNKKTKQNQKPKTKMQNEIFCWREVKLKLIKL